MNRIHEGMFALTRICTSFPKTVVALVLLATLGFALFAKDVERDHSVEGMLPPHEPIRDHYREFREHFNVRDKIAIALFHEAGVLAPGLLAQVDRISRALEASGLVDEVTSLTTVENVTAEDGQIVVGPLLKALPHTEGDIRALRQTLFANPLIARVLVSPDEKATMIVAQPTFDLWETGRCVAAHEAFKAILAADPGPGRSYLAGYPMMTGLADRAMNQDNRLMLPLILAAVIVLLGAAFRSLRGVWIPLSVVAGSTVWTFGAMQLLGFKITFVSTSIPIVLVAMGIADGIHVLHEYTHRLRSGEDNLAAVRRTMTEMNAPVVMTSLTTAAGFVSLGATSIVPIRQYGIAVAIGILAAMFLSLCFIPACLVLLGKPKRLPSAEEAEGRLLHRWSRIIGRFSIRHARLVIAAFVLGLFLTSALATRIRAQQDPTHLFRQDSEIRVSDEFINTHFPGTGSIYLQVDSREDDGVKNPELLQRIRRTQERMEPMPEVGNSLSLADFLVHMHRVLHDGDPAYARVPGTTEDLGPQAGPDEGRAMVSQYLLLYEMSGGTQLESILDEACRRTTIGINVKSNSSEVYERVLARLEAAAAEIFGDRADILLTGSGMLVLKVVQYLVLGQVYSLASTILVVFLLLAVMFRSLLYAAIGMIPLLITVASNFAFMVVAGIPLNIGTAMIASVCVGIGVDYSIHFIHRYRIEAARTPDLDATIQATMETSGRAIFFNAAAVGGGFAVLLVSNFMPLVYLGSLVPLIMAVNALAALFIIPAFLNVRVLTAR